MGYMVMWFLTTILTFLQMKNLQRPFLCTRKPFNLRDITFKETNIQVRKTALQDMKVSVLGLYLLPNCYFPTQHSLGKKQGDWEASSFPPIPFLKCRAAEGSPHPALLLPSGWELSYLKHSMFNTVISSDVFGTVPGMQDAFCCLKTRQSEVDRLFRSARALSPFLPSDERSWF